VYRKDTKEGEMNIFKPSDIFQFAVRIEEDGEIFYHKAALMAEDADTRDIFNRLADEEIRHKRIFTDMLATIKQSSVPETYSGEYLAYLRNYIDGKVIFKKDLRDAALPEIKDTLSAIDFAMEREMDSILYYQEVKQFLAEKDRVEVDLIIEEERKHFAKLAEIRKKYISS
jgi:rubrerythrin